MAQAVVGRAELQVLLQVGRVAPEQAFGAGSDVAEVYRGWIQKDAGAALGRSVDYSFVIIPSFKLILN